jgi:hypothetical protein
VSVLFRNDKQRATVCEALCAQVGLRDFWTEEGPSAQAKELLKEEGGTMSSGERIMFLTAWAVWNGHGKVLFADVIERLDDTNLEAVGNLLVAFATDSIDEWLKIQEVIN